jgi:ABC-type branched-subunit amino acid transport system substrate-binding protein
MTGSKRHVVTKVIVGLCAALWTPVLAAGDLTLEEQRGREIYLRGMTADGRDIVALLDGGATRANASVFPCASCHGAEGKGKNEGGVSTPDITWATLTKPYPLVRPSGVTRPPYSERTLKRAIVMGLDSGGRELQPSMPHFQLSYSDANDLIAFLKDLGRFFDPGISESIIRIGVLLPQMERLPAMHRSIQTVLSRYFDHVNNGGGIYGHRIELRFLDLQDSPSESVAMIRRWLERESIFALTGSFLAGAERDLAPVFSQSGTPVICAFALDPDSGGVSPNPYVFYLDAGLRGELEELIGLAQKQFPSGARLVVAAAPYDVTRKLSQYVKASFFGARWSVSEVTADANGCRSAAGNPLTQVVFWITPQFSADTLQECSSILSKQAMFFVPGSFTTRELGEIHETLDHRVFVTMPVASLARQGEGTGSASVALDTRVGPERDTVEASTRASADLLAWALQRAGRNVSRQRLVETLEGAYNLDFGLGFPITYGRNRHVGGYAYKAFVLDVRQHAVMPVNP